MKKFKNNSDTNLLKFEHFLVNVKFSKKEGTVWPRWEIAIFTKWNQTYTKSYLNVYLPMGQKGFGIVARVSDFYYCWKFWILTRNLKIDQFYLIKFPLNLLKFTIWIIHDGSHTFSERYYPKLHFGKKSSIWIIHICNCGHFEIILLIYHFSSLGEFSLKICLKMLKIVKLLYKYLKITEGNQFW